MSEDERENGIAEACEAFDCDVVFCDPPFANFDLPSLRAAIDTIVPAASVPLFMAFNSRREQELNAAFAGRQVFVRTAGIQLGYESVKSKTQQRICLFGPPSAASETAESSE